MSFTGSKMPAPGQTISGAPSSLSVKEKSPASSAQLVTSVFLNKTFAASDASVRVWASGVSCKSPMTTLHPFDCRSLTNSRPMPLVSVS